MGRHGTRVPVDILVLEKPKQHRNGGGTEAEELTVHPLEECLPPGIGEDLLEDRQDRRFAPGDQNERGGNIAGPIPMADVVEKQGQDRLPRGGKAADLLLRRGVLPGHETLHEVME